MAPQRRWKVHQQQQALLEYAGLSGNCPSGVYVSYHPSNPCQWSGVYFVRKGSYSTAPLRFRLTFPVDYPELPPSIVFSNDLFHPLVCPLTTYTYSTASPARQPVSSADSKRLSPGQLNLQHAFPVWFEDTFDGRTGAVISDASSATDSQAVDDVDLSGDEFNHVSPANKPQTNQDTRLPFMPPPKADALEYSSTKQYPSIVDVLRYMVGVFEEDELLDAVPLDMCANSGAYHAWVTHRRRVKEVEAVREAAKARQGDGAAPETPRPTRTRLQTTPAASPGRSPAERWNWDGVWQERVQKSVKSATVSGKLYKDDDADAHQLITFLDREKEEYMLMKVEALKAGGVFESSVQ